jgi:hypothetical protein
MGNCERAPIPAMPKPMRRAASVLYRRYLMKYRSPFQLP